jgi:hypothetical protein
MADIVSVKKLSDSVRKLSSLSNINTLIRAMNLPY